MLCVSCYLTLLPFKQHTISGGFLICTHQQVSPHTQGPEVEFCEILNGYTFQKNLGPKLPKGLPRPPNLGPLGIIGAIPGMSGWWSGLGPIRSYLGLGNIGWWGPIRPGIPGKPPEMWIRKISKFWVKSLKQVDYSSAAMLIWLKLGSLADKKTSDTSAVFIMCVHCSQASFLLYSSYLHYTGNWCWCCVVAIKPPPHFIIVKFEFTFSGLLWSPNLFWDEDQW